MSVVGTVKGVLVVGTVGMVERHARDRNRPTRFFSRATIFFLSLDKFSSLTDSQLSIGHHWGLAFRFFNGTVVSMVAIAFILHCTKASCCHLVDSVCLL